MAVDTIMMVLERVACNVGFVFLLGGGILLFGTIAALAILLVCDLWICASNRFRDICKAESLIHEYRRNREKFLEWLEMEKKKEDCNGKA